MKWPSPCNYWPYSPPHSSSLTAANLAKLLGPRGLYCPWHQQKSRVSIHPEANPASQPGETSASSAILQVFKGMGRAHAFFHWPWETVVAKKKLSALPEKDLPHTQKGCVWDHFRILVQYREGGKGRHLQAWTQEFWVLTPILPGPGWILMSYS